MAVWCLISADCGVDRFDGIEFVTYWPGCGLPCLPDAIAVFRCAVTGILSAGDHDLLLGTLADSKLNPVGRPLLWYSRDLRIPSELTLVLPS